MKKHLVSLGSLKTGRSQERLFLEREYVAILGKRALVFWTLYAIVLVSLTAVAISRTGLMHLKEQMEDPFTSWVDIPASNLSVGKNYPFLKAYLDSCVRVDAFRATNSSGSYIGSVNIWARSDGIWEYCRVQSFGFWNDRKLLLTILKEENVVEKFIDTDPPESWRFTDGVIVSQALLKKIGLSAQELRGNQLLLQNSFWNFPVKVLAVVRTLPAKIDMLCEHALLRGIENGIADQVLQSTSKELSMILDTSGKTDSSRINATVDGLASRMGATDNSLGPDSEYATHDTRLELVLPAATDITEMPKIQDQLNNIRELRDIGATVLYRMNYVPPDSTLQYGTWDDEQSNIFDKFNITFEPLDSIGAFQRNLERRFDLQLDLASVRAKENFNTVYDLSRFLISALVLFAAMSILLFVYNLLKNHLERIQMNLGTFMAFGMSEDFLLRGYLRIIMQLLVRVIGLAMLTLLALQGIGRLLDYSGMTVPVLLSDLDVATNGWIYLTLLLLLASSFFIFRWQLRGFLANTPGDLIYARK